MLFRLILLFTLVPVVELVILIKLSLNPHIGPFLTIFIVILTGVVGAILAKLQGLGVIRRINLNLTEGALPTNELFNGFLILIAGALLITPGLITDAVGFLILIPFTRAFLMRWLIRKAKEMIATGGAQVTFFRRL